jgi:hypothetical protein
MKTWVWPLAALALLTGCVTGPARDLSGIVKSGAPGSDAQPLSIGIVADSQFQTLGNFDNVRFYKGRFEDAAVWVSIRPPALDATSRSLLRTHLETLRARGAKAIFFLGDGANNGCLDEFSVDSTRPGEEGVLRILDEFRTLKQIPIYFVLGNHDFLGAGSTSHSERRKTFCRETRAGYSNRPLSKLEVIRAVDAFNRKNSFDGWSYHSSLGDGAATERACGTNPALQARTHGCYLAARVDYRSGGPAVQFILLDSNDWVDVSPSRLGYIDQEGLRGAMSFHDEDSFELPSQTRWFERNAAEPVAMRVAMTHYNVSALRKKVPFFGAIADYTQRFMDLFTVPGAPRAINQDAAYVVSAHTHNPEHKERTTPIKVICDKTRRGCARTQRFRIDEVNVGSTTDFSNYSTLVHLVPADGRAGDLFYERAEIDRTACKAIYEELDKDDGWADLGIDRQARHNYRRFTSEQVRAVWTKVGEFSRGDPERANCIGLYAAALEKDPPLADALRR